MEKNIQHASVLFRNRAFLLACIGLNKVIGIIIRMSTFDNYKKIPRIDPEFQSRDKRTNPLGHQTICINE